MAVDAEPHLVFAAGGVDVNVGGAQRESPIDEVDGRRNIGFGQKVGDRFQSCQRARVDVPDSAAGLRGILPLGLVPEQRLFILKRFDQRGCCLIATYSQFREESRLMFQL